MLETFGAGGAVFRVDTQEKKIALTIDDGPHPTISPLILDLLDEHDAKATFFLIASNVQGHEDIVGQMVQEGHELGNHMLENNFSLRLEPDKFDRQIIEADKILQSYQSDLIWYRPGGGIYNKAMLNSVTHHGYRVAIGSVYPYDANISEPMGGQQFMENYILRNTQSGDILILHDGMIRTVLILETVVPHLIDEGYEFVTLSNLHANSIE